MDTFLQQVVNGLTLGCVYAVVALGYTMVYGIIQLINFAHGEVVMIGAMVAFTAINLLAAAGMPPIVVVLLGTACAVPVCVLVGYLMERLAYLTQGDTVEMQDLGFILTPANEAPAWVASDQPLSEATDQFQTEYIKKAIARTKGNMSEAAERLGLHRSNLYRKMKQLDMET